MTSEQNNHHNLSKLTDLPNVGLSTAQDLRTIGINKPTDLEGCDPYQLYEKLCTKTGKEHNLRVLDVFISITRFLAGEAAKPWWTYSAERRAVLDRQHKKSQEPTVVQEDQESIGKQADDAGGIEGTNPDADVCKNGLIDYVELPCRDLRQTEDFFQRVFEWTFTAYGEQYTTFSGSGINGGFYLSPQVSHSANGSALIVIYEANLPAMQARIIDAGGYISRAIFAFPGGYRFHFLDPNGNEWAVWSDREL